MLIELTRNLALQIHERFGKPDCPFTISWIDTTKNVVVFFGAKDQYEVPLPDDFCIAIDNGKYIFAARELFFP